jgi:transcription elongation factor SPT5
VYIEASTVDDIRFLLRGVGGIVRSQDQVPIIDVVPLDDRVPLLEMSMTGMDPTSLSWVRLKCRGKYRNDLGLVLEFDPLEFKATVYVVPRTHISKRNLKRKHSPQRVPADLFDAEQIKMIYGPDSVERRNQVYCFKKEIYKNGLLEKEVRLSDISYTNVLATQSELDMFRRSGDEQVIRALDARVVPLQIGDRIQATIGTFRGLKGRVVDIGDDRTVSVEFESDVDRGKPAGERGATSGMTVSRFH